MEGVGGGFLRVCVACLFVNMRFDFVAGGGGRGVFLHPLPAGHLEA